PLGEQFGAAEAFAPPCGGNESVNSQADLPGEGNAPSETLLGSAGGVKPGRIARASWGCASATRLALHVLLLSRVVSAPAGLLHAAGAGTGGGARRMLAAIVTVELLLGIECGATLLAFIGIGIGHEFLQCGLGRRREEPPPSCTAIDRWLGSSCG